MSKMDKPERRRTEITIETHSLTIIRVQNGETAAAFCDSCEAPVNVFAPATAALIFRVNADFLETLFRSNQIHRAADNALCGNSLADYFRQEIRFIED